MRVRLRLVLMVVGALALVGGGIWAGWSWRHPHAFRDWDGRYSASLVDARIGETHYFGLTDPNELTTTVTLRSAAPRVEVNTAGATFDVLECIAPPQGEDFGIGVANEQDIGRFCELSSIADARLSPQDKPARTILLAITPHRAGVVKVRGVDVRYDAGWRSGVQRIGGNSGLTTGRHMQLGLGSH